MPNIRKSSDIYLSAPVMLDYLNKVAKEAQTLSCAIHTRRPEIFGEILNQRNRLT